MYIYMYIYIYIYIYYIYIHIYMGITSIYIDLKSLFPSNSTEMFYKFQFITNYIHMTHAITVARGSYTVR